ncbi:hypothetical protein PSI23_21825 [Xenorhabdus sp. XENO-10]|uniref:Uncharacterized protein n=1 Tax=Xenorhabdus yunnanensis TaxID=3025878 RepID=A0ABT5LPV3_9GAMM|nr:hypothetical protein [Xenorhabdus yunnanensis]
MQVPGAETRSENSATENAGTTGTTGTEAGEEDVPRRQQHSEHVPVAA